ncbi:MAG TPA: hypothetical protein VHJ78_02195 [Actinomycetota bacterium]|nr:hypothetical protein [Actinomycetota bacterium]
MSTTDRAMMLGIRHRCGQEIQFWIPAYLVAPMLGDLHDLEVESLASWMDDQGMLSPEAPEPDNLVEHLRTQLAPRHVAFVDVEKDASVCPSCGSLIPWVDAVTEYVAGRARGDY